MPEAVSPLMRRLSCNPARLIKVLMSNWRRFKFGTRSVPPAMNIEPGFEAAMSDASATDRGCKYRSRGRRSTYLPFHSSGTSDLMTGGN